MKKCFMLRHQKAGIITSHVFTSKPTDAQLAPLIAQLKIVHAEGWTVLHEAELVPGDQVPDVAPVAAGGSSALGGVAAVLQINGVGAGDVQGAGNAQAEV